MKLHQKVLAAGLVVLLAAGCKTTKNAAARTDDGKIEVVYVQVNDVYEIAPIAGGKEGGMARVATLKKQYLAQNPNTFLVIAGDFLSPSVYNSIKYNNQRVRGAQMVAAMNAAGMDIAAFGNHEFDISESELQSRLNESQFQYVSSNAFHKVNGNIVAFAKTNVNTVDSVPATWIQTVKDADGTVAKIGYIGLTIASNKAPFVTYTDPFATARQLYDQLKDSVDAVVAVTHQTVADDEKLAAQIPGLAMILGGHEHGMEFKKVGNVYITKAHSNARSAYIVKLDMDKQKHRNTVPKPELKYLDEKVAIDSATDVVVQQWKKIADDNFSSIGFDPHKIVMQSGEPLDGRETEIRAHQTNLSRLIANAMLFACSQAEASIFNTGSVRLDDILTPPVSQYDIIRSLPFGGGIVEANISGAVLQRVLQAGLTNIRSGGFLQYAHISFDSASHSFHINNQPIDTGKSYRIAFSDYLISGLESNLDFLKAGTPGITVYPAGGSSSQSDIRLAIINYLATMP